MPKHRTGPSQSPLAWLLLSFRGRISRRIYWPAFLAVFCLNFALYFQLAGMTKDDLEGWRPFLLFLGAAATLFANIAIAVKRLHDVGYGGFLAIAVALPILNFAFAIWVGLLPGSNGPNTYGDAPDIPPS